jgi:hypothetical protein
MRSGNALAKFMALKNQVTLSLKKAACQRLEMERQAKAFFALEAMGPVREKTAYLHASIRVLCREEIHVQ